MDIDAQRCECPDEHSIEEEQASEAAFMARYPGIL